MRSYLALSLRGILRAASSSLNILQVPLILIFALLAIALSELSYKAVRDVMVEVDQRFHLPVASTLAQELKERVGDTSACEILRPEIVNLEREHRRYQLYLVEPGGLVRCSSQERTISEGGESVHFNPIARLAERGVVAVPLAAYDPRDPTNPKIFSSSLITLGGRDFYLFVVINGGDLLVFDKYHSGLKRLKDSLRAFRLFFSITAALLLIRLLLQRSRTPPTITIPLEASHSAPASREEHEVSFLASAVSAIAQQLATKVVRFDVKEQERRLFISGLSHDLRTPLATVRAYVDTLIKSTDLTKEEVKHHISVVERNIDHVRSFVEQIVEGSRLDGISDSLKLGRVSLQGIIEGVIAQHKLSAEEKMISLSSQLPADQLSVNADGMLMERAISNLVHNALKFTQTGGEVEVALTREGPQAILSVRDSGTGIPEEEVPKVFDQFFRGALQRKDRRSGFGLGLYIVKKIVEAHGGEISVESRVGHGTTFKISLPLDRS